MTVGEKLVTIAENQQKIFDLGKQDEYNAFWDAYQKAEDGSFRQINFTGAGWNDVTFKPKYNIYCTGNCSSMFQRCAVTNLTKALFDRNVALYTSGATSLTYAFAQMETVELHTIDISQLKGTNAKNLFYGSKKLRYIDQVTFPWLELDTTGMFHGCEELEEIRIGGKIMSDISFQWSPKLSFSSLSSIILALYNYSGSGVTRTLTLGSNNIAKLTDTKKREVIQKGWDLA